MNSKVKSMLVFGMTQKEGLKINRKKSLLDRSTSQKKARLLLMNNSICVGNKSKDSKFKKEKNKSLTIEGKSLKASQVREKKQKPAKESVLKITKQVKNKVEELKTYDGDKRENWEEFLEKYKKDSALGEIISEVCRGYEIILEEMRENNKENEENKKKGKKKSIKINSLNLAAVKKENIPDYYDEFMSKANDFSTSWTDLLVLQKRHN